MPVLPILDVAIGLSFFYLLIALLCTTLNEMIATWLKSRSRTLEKGIERLVGGDIPLKDAIYHHGLIRNLASSDGGKPSYIPADKFALALMDIVTGPNHVASNPDALRQGLVAMASSNVKQALGAALQNQDPTLITDQKKIETWFNDHMDRVSGWYKRTAQNRVLLLALVITVVLNADTLNVSRLLWSNPAVTATLVEAAKDRLSKGRPDGEPLPIVEYPNPNDPTESTPLNLPARDTISEDERNILGDLTGWGNDGLAAWKKAHTEAGMGTWMWEVVPGHLLGWIITLLAVSLGAPFWFDTLNRFVNIRGAGRSPNEPRDKNSSKAVAST